MLRKKILIFCFLLALMTLAASQGQCENWKEFIKNGDGTYYYDKDSIHYPVKKKILGLTVQNKDIVNVWTRWVPKSGESGEGYLTRIYCVERECDGCGLIYPDSKKPPVSRDPMAPGSGGESLLKIVCP